MGPATARSALESGRPLPLLAPDRDDDQGKTKAPGTHHDVRGGIGRIAGGAGLWRMLGARSNTLRYLGAIPGFSGVARRLCARLATLFGRKDRLPPRVPSARP